MTIDWELLLKVGAFIIAMIGAIPGIVAIRRQLKMEKHEAKKLIVEAEAISADIAAKYIESAGNIQDFYSEILEEVKKQLSECKDVVCRIEGKVENLTLENEKLKEIVKEQNLKIEELEKGITILSAQVTELGQKPRYQRKKGGEDAVRN